MSLSPMAAAMLAALTSQAPPARHAAFEAPADTQARYEAIAEQMIAAAEERPIGPGPSGVVLAAALLGGVAIHESRLDPQIDAGHCPDGLCPGGAVCIVQIEQHPRKLTPEGWSRDDLRTDRSKCLRRGMRILASSWWTCRRDENGQGTPSKHRLAAYASGTCDHGREAAAELWQIATRVLSHLQRAPAAPPALLASPVAPRPRGWIGAACVARP